MELAHHRAVGGDHLAGDERVVVAHGVEGGDLPGDVEVAADQREDTGDEERSRRPGRAAEPYLPPRRALRHMALVSLGRRRRRFRLGLRFRFRFRSGLGGFDHRGRAGQIVRSRLGLRLLLHVPPGSAAPAVLLRERGDRPRRRFRRGGLVLGQRDLEPLSRRHRGGLGPPRRGQGRGLPAFALHPDRGRGPRRLVPIGREDGDLLGRGRVVLDAGQRAARLGWGPFGRRHEGSGACNRGRPASMPLTLSFC